MMNWLRNFMYGRRGSDELNWALIIFYVVLSLLLPRSLRLLLWIPLVLFWFRFLSRDIYRRSAENQKFLELTAPVQRTLRAWNSRLKDREHRYYNCPRCHQTLRVPRGRGKIAISCPNCKTTIIKKT